eukprot:2116058-Prymnesium_polylepis.1
MKKDQATTGRELVNERLADMLKRQYDANRGAAQIDLKPEEWEACMKDSLQKVDLQLDDFIRVEVASGLRWRKIGRTKPSTGRELHNEQLAARLASRDDLSQQEWREFEKKEQLRSREEALRKSDSIAPVDYHDFVLRTSDFVFCAKNGCYFVPVKETEVRFKPDARRELQPSSQGSTRPNGIFYIFDPASNTYTEVKVRTEACATLDMLEKRIQEELQKVLPEATCKLVEEPSGLKWNEVVKEKPVAGKKLLTNKKLAEALWSKTAFAPDEWEAFGITDLAIEHCIKSGDRYFQPAVLQRFELTLNRAAAGAYVVCFQCEKGDPPAGVSPEGFFQDFHKILGTYPCRTPTQPVNAFGRSTGRGPHVAPHPAQLDTLDPAALKAAELRYAQDEIADADEVSRPPNAQGEPTANRMLKAVRKARLARATYISGQLWGQSGRLAPRAGSPRAQSSGS